LYQNYRNSDPALTQINTLLIAWFLARVVMYLTIYGSFDLDLPFFVGVVGLSLSLNGGVRRFDEVETGSGKELASLAPISATSFGG
jgi:hypothetical protein